MSSVFQALTQKFDKICLLTLSNRTETRTKPMMRMLRNIGLENESDICVYKTVPFPLNNIIIKGINQMFNGQHFTKPAEFDCMRSHYNMIRTAYDEGVQNLLVMEDDLCFLKDEHRFIDVIHNMPEKYLFCQFDGFSMHPGLKNILDTTECWVEHPSIGIWNTDMYAISRDGMKAYMDFQDKVCWVADGPMYQLAKNKVPGVYFTPVPLCIQADKNLVPSDIRNVEGADDNINYETDNVCHYYINTENYFEYLCHD